jgi:hypothetical protein
MPFASKESMPSNPVCHSDAADSFCAGCLTGAGRVTAARRAVFLRRKYARRRLRLIRTRSCCPMESLWIENRRNAISVETDPAFSTKPYGLCSPLPLRRGEDLSAGLESPPRNQSKDPHPPPLLAKERRPVGGLAFTPWIKQPTIKPHGSPVGR